MHCVEQFKVRFEEFAYALCREAGAAICAHYDAPGAVAECLDAFVGAALRDAPSAK